MQEKQAKIKREKEIEENTGKKVVIKGKEEETFALTQGMQRKMAEQQKWKDVWETEMQFRKLQVSIESGKKTQDIKKQILTPSASLPKDVIGSLSAGREIMSPLSNRNAAPGFFITSDQQNDLVLVKKPMSRQSNLSIKSVKSYTNCIKKGKRRSCL